MYTENKNLNGNFSGKYWYFIIFLKFLEIKFIKIQFLVIFFNIYIDNNLYLMYNFNVKTTFENRLAPIDKWVYNNLMEDSYNEKYIYH